MRFGLRWQVLFALTVALLVAVLLVSFTVLGVTWRTVTEQGRASARQTAELVTATASAAVDTGAPLAADGNAGNLQRLLDVAVEGADDVSIVIVDASGHVVAAAPPGAEDAVEGAVEALIEVQRSADGAVGLTDGEGPLHVHVITPLRLGDVTLGAVWLRQDLTSATRRLRQAQPVIVTSVALIALFVLALGYLLLTRAIVNPLRQLSHATERVTDGDLEARVRGRAGRGELGDLARNFDRMVERIRAQHVRLEGQVAELAETNARLEQASQEAIRSEKLATLGTLAAGIAHEVGNPLTAIIGLLELLEDAEDAEERDDTQGRIRREVERIHGILRELLDYARVRSEPGASVALREPVDAAVRLASHHRRARSVRVDVDLPDDLPAIHVPENRLVQVLLNLLLNASDAMDGRGHVRISARRIGDGRVELDVVDDGPGIPAEVVERIFDPFFTTKDPGVGTGLGLATAERIIAEFGGTIAVDPAWTDGARFVLELPCDAPSADVDPSTEPSDAPTDGSDGADEAGQGAGADTTPDQDDFGSPGTPSGK